MFGFCIGSLAFCTANQEYFQQIIAKTTSTRMRDNISAEMSLKEMEKKLDEFYEKFEKYCVLSDELQQLTSILEKQTTLSWADLDKFKSRPEVRASVERLKERFGPEL